MIDPNLCQECGGRGDVDMGQMCLLCGGTGRGEVVEMPDAVYVSFGGGVQSTAIAMLVINKDPRLLAVTNGMLPKSFIFADTGEEPRAVYEHIEMMKQKIEAAGLVFKTVKKPGRLGDTVFNGRLDIPAWVLSDRGDRKPARRACTFDWKVTVLDREAKRLHGINLRKRSKQPVVAQWYGMSRDEVQRMRVSKDVWRWFVYPLVSMRWTRDDCLKYLESIGMSAPKSACTFCPFHGDDVWRSLEPADLQRAIDVEEEMQRRWREKDAKGILARLRSMPTLRRDGIPLKDRPFDNSDNPSEMGAECAGICGC